MLKTSYFFVPVLLIALAFPPASALAKGLIQPTGTFVLGTVRDAETGEPIVGAAVMIARTGDNTGLSAADMQPRVTDAQGRFRMPINSRKGAKNEIYVWATWYMPSAIATVVTGAKSADLRFDLQPEPVGQSDMKVVRAPIAKRYVSKDGKTRAIIRVVDARTGKPRLDLPPTFSGNSLGVLPVRPDATGRYIFASEQLGGAHRFYLVNGELRLPEQKKYYHFQVPTGKTVEMTIYVVSP
jgi:hypothetical protein